MDLRTTYMGMSLKNPIVHSASPLSESIDKIRRMEDAGVSAVVMHSLFEEQLTLESQELDHYLDNGGGNLAEALSYFPKDGEYKEGPEEYLETINRAKEAAGIPIIASLNGVSAGTWIEYAKRIEQAGADALELNIYFLPTDPTLTGTEVEQMYIDVVSDVRKSVSMPVAVKLSPFFSAPVNIAHKLSQAGADALVLFNRFYQPDLDLEKLEVAPHLFLSDSKELRVPLRWVAILYGRVSVDLGITTGIHTHIDALKGLMAGAKVTMITSEILQHGIDRITDILEKMTAWLEERDYESVTQIIGSMSQKNCPQPAAFERANYVKALHLWQPDQTG